MLLFGLLKDRVSADQARFQPILPTLLCRVSLACGSLMAAGVHAGLEKGFADARQWVVHREVVIDFYSSGGSSAGALRCGA